MTYKEYGAATLPPLLLLSGWAQDHRLFKNVAPRLQDDFHVFALNWRGHDPKVPLEGDFGTAELADDVIEFVDDAGLDGFRMVSHSHGCWVNLEVCDRLGAGVIDTTVVIDWLMEPHDGFLTQVREGRVPEKYEAARQSMFDEWAATTDNVDVLHHIYEEMPSFGGEMWMRSNREIENAYTTWGSPLKRMEALGGKVEVTHLFSQPLLESYRTMQDDYARENPWFHPVYIPGNTHFPSLENGEQVARGILDAFHSPSVKSGPVAR
jgi:pimeloyl-ACP methyl ester carboxylesterase